MTYSRLMWIAKYTRKIIRQKKKTCSKQLVEKNWTTAFVKDSSRQDLTVRTTRHAKQLSRDILAGRLLVTTTVIIYRESLNVIIININRVYYHWHGALITVTVCICHTGSGGGGPATLCSLYPTGYDRRLKVVSFHPKNINYHDDDRVAETTAQQRRW